MNFLVHFIHPSCPNCSVNSNYLIISYGATDGLHLESAISK